MLEGMNAIKTRNDLLAELRTETFDVLIIGAGITGAGIAWDAALRGLKTAIIDKNDFGYGTSSGSSKLVHAGIRYLAYGEFRLVRNASRERQLLFQLCPHQTRPLPFLIPIFKKGKNTFLKMFFATTMYDILAGFKNYQNKKFISREKTIELIPNIRKEGLKRGVIYWDGFMDDARVTLETILSAKDAGAITANYVEAISFLQTDEDKKKDRVSGAIVRDNLSDETFDIKAKVVINATGPWTDQTIRLLNQPSRILRTTKGIHVITKRVIEEDIVLVITADDERGMFIIPFREEYSLIGTTDTDYKENFDHVDVTEEDINYVVSAVNNDMPGMLSKKDIISAYSGIRPLIISPNAKSETDTSRNFDIFETRTNLFTITGGKYTLFRYMAEKMIDRVLAFLGLDKKDYPCQTKKHKLHGAKGINDMDEYLKKHVPKIIEEFKLDKDSAEHIVHTYGSNHDKILEIIKQKPTFAKRIAKGRPYITGEIQYIVENELAYTLNDFMFRRTQLQLLDHQGLDCAEQIAQIMAKYLEWDKTEIKQQFSDYKKNLVWKP
ncbi:MAG: FAD-dependent oxidoreductase [Candidatus Heimdallarchaeota archaeon]|nr:FAD-dependent oxidoreductase [Candidatus Heimdallarchaeota archaeon]